MSSQLGCPDPLLQTDREREELSGRVASQRDVLHSVRSELESSSKALTTSSSETSQLRSKVKQLQNAVEEGTRYMYMYLVICCIY